MCLRILTDGVETLTTRTQLKRTESSTRTTASVARSILDMSKYITIVSAPSLGTVPPIGSSMKTLPDTGRPRSVMTFLIPLIRPTRTPLTHADTGKQGSTPLLCTREMTTFVHRFSEIGITLTETITGTKP